jgi:hypothetical protein
MELHSTYRQRVSDFYLACELKFQLNSITDDDETMRLPLLFNSMICGPGLIVRDDSRSLERPQPIMPTESHEDFSQVSGNKLVMLRDNLQSSISKREKL